jgi:carbon monoxide dehydrogenase subunit G
MKVAGEAGVRGSVETVWDALHAAAVLARAIPGCEQFEITGPGLAEFVATTVLPAIGGTYAGKLTIVEQQRPGLLRLTASAAGDHGTITADVTVSLGDGTEAGVSAARASGAVSAPPASGAVSAARASAVTLVSYEANGTVTGPVAAVGTRLLTTAAKRLAAEFFAAIDASVAAGQAATSAPLAAVPAAAETTAAKTTAAKSAGSRLEPAASDARRPPSLDRPGPLADNRAALVAGAAIGLAGIVIGVLAGRRGGRAGRETT